MNKKKYSIYFVLGLIITLITTITISTLYYFEYSKTKQELYNKIDDVSNSTLIELEHLLVPYIESYSIDEYSYILDNKMKDKNIFAIVLKDYNMGKMLGKESYIIGKIRDEDWDAVNYDENNLNQNQKLKNQYLVDSAIMYNFKKQKLGEVIIYSSDRHILKELEYIIEESISFSILTSIILIAILFVFIKTIILKPLENIVSTITDSNFNTNNLKTIDENGFREIYKLSSTINKMINSIKESQNQLEDLNSNLNQKVVDKTKELQDLNRSLEEKIQQEIKTSKQKDLMLHNQSKFASMGEMIGNIAHQWRQPLNALSITLQKMERFYQLGKLDEEKMNKSISKSMQLIQKMSTTIDDFMGFFRKDKVRIPFDIVKAIDETITLLEASLKNSSIELDFNKPQGDLKKIFGYKGEFTQVILNIISNAKDALVEKNILSPNITIKISDFDTYVKIEILDNAGGIPEDIKDYIFDPYFTTKEEGKGTGIGLYMSKIIVEKNMNGKLSATDIDGGTCFTILIDYDFNNME